MPAILMIDDDADFGELTKAFFAKLGYALTLVPNGADGLAKAAVLKPDLIFLDIMMPGMNGIEVLRELHAGDETGDIPVIILSGKYIDGGMLELFAQERNFRAFLPKPVELARLKHKVEEILKK